MQQSKIEFRKVRDFGGILNVTFEYIKINFKLLVKANLFISAPSLLLAGVFMGIYQSSMFSLSADSTLELIGIPFVISMFFTFISYLLITVVTYSHLINYKNSDNGIFNLEDVWLVVKQNFLPITLTIIGYIIFIVLGFVFLIIPGIYLSIAMSIIFIVRLEENLSFFDAIRRCTKLISGHWWFTFGVLFVVSMIQGFLTYALYMPSYFVMIFVSFTGINSESSGLERFLYILTAIISSFAVLLYMISIIATTFQYYNLVERKEAPGLLEQIDQIK